MSLAVTGFRNVSEEGLPDKLTFLNPVTARSTRKKLKRRDRITGLTRRGNDEGVPTRKSSNPIPDDEVSTRSEARRISC